jgi:hypothetical protein
MHSLRRLGPRGAKVAPMNARAAARYFVEFTPTADTPAVPCQCGDRVFYQVGNHDGPTTPWRCRTCQPPGKADGAS